MEKIISDHPIDPHIRVRIEHELSLIEKTHEVHILFACESGSRGWGFASPDSDYDVRFLYVHRLPWYLAVEAKREVIECPISDELDISGWELRKALRLLRRSNPVLFEWLSSPVVYRQDIDFIEKLRQIMHSHFSPLRGRYHYLSMAKKNFRGYLQGEIVRLKKYLYVLRPLLAAQWIDARGDMPPMPFADLANACIKDAPLRAEINALLRRKMCAGEAEYSPRFLGIHDFIQSELEAHQIAPDFKKVSGDVKALDDLLMDCILDEQS